MSHQPTAMEVANSIIDQAFGKALRADEESVVRRHDRNMEIDREIAQGEQAEDEEVMPLDEGVALMGRGYILD